MRIARSPHQHQTIFGDGYVSEQHADAADRHLPPQEKRIISFRDATSALRGAMLAEIVKSVRSALSLRRSAP
jgi:hypothetical protein